MCTEKVTIPPPPPPPLFFVLNDTQEKQNKPLANLLELDVSETKITDETVVTVS
jgi:hypothetical protein